jgi:ribosome-binding protein aMBF1 (putative translation factor)
MQLKAEHIRAARALLGWSQSDLAGRTRLGLRTIKRVEAGEVLTASADLSIRRTLEEQGVAFVFNADDLAGREVVAGAVLVRDQR